MGKGLSKKQRKKVKRLNKELNRCPFCGGKARLVHLDLDSIEPGWKVWGVMCNKDNKAEFAQGHMIENLATPEEAVRTWNGMRNVVDCKVCQFRSDELCTLFEFETSYLKHGACSWGVRK